MAENYKHLYEQTKKMLTMYQDELIPGFRKKIEELEAKVATDNNVGSKWIPVTERLPETELVRYRDEAEPSGYGEYYASEVVLVFATNHKIYLAIYCESNESNWWDSDAGLYEDVTHWMPLPQPPKGE